MQIRIQAILNAFRAWPSLDMWLLSFFVTFIYGITAYWLGSRSGLVGKSYRHLPIGQQILLAVRLLIHPAISEETIFRGFLLALPSGPSPTSSSILWLVISLTLFILIHPLNGLIFRRSALATFSNATFLGLAGLLGICASALYWLSASLWPAIFLHWFVVFFWITRFGGHTSLIKQA